MRLPIAAVAALVLLACVGDEPPVEPPAVSADGGSDAGSNGGLAFVVEPGAIVLTAGGVASLKVRVDRATYAGDLLVELLALPTGVVAATPTVPVGQSDVDVELRADRQALPTDEPVTATVRATGTDGRVVASRTVTVAVRGTPGTLDVAFGKTGISEVPPGALVLPMFADALSVDDKARIVVGGFSGPLTAPATLLARMDRVGNLDPTFGSGGKAGGQDGRLMDLTLDGNGRLVAVGQSKVNAAPVRSAAFFRYSPDGIADPTFGTAGIRMEPLSGEARLNAVLVEGDTMFGVGQATSAGYPQCAIVRLAPDGTATSGQVGYPEEGWVLNAIRRDARNAKLLVGGAPNSFRIDPAKVSPPWQAAPAYDGAVSLAEAANGRTVIARYNAVRRVTDQDIVDGLDFTNVGIFVFTVLVEDDGAIVLAGQTTATKEAAILRLLPDGTRDQRFGVVGLLTLPQVGPETRVVRLARSGADRLVGLVRASTDTQANAKVSVVRLWH